MVTKNMGKPLMNPARLYGIVVVCMLLVLAAARAWASEEQITGSSIAFKLGSSSATLVQVASLGTTTGLIISTTSIAMYPVTPTATVALDVGQGRTDNGYAYIDLHSDATYSDYGLRIIRANTGPNDNSVLYHRGTGAFYLYTVEAGDLVFGTSNTRRMTVTAGGLVGIGAITPTVALDANGTVYARSVNAGAATSINWASGNQQYTSANCGAFTFTNMQDGGQYTLAIQGQGGGTCSFAQSGLTADMASTDTGKQPLNTDVVYTFKRIGTTLYVMPPMTYATFGSSAASCPGYDRAWTNISPHNGVVWDNIAMSKDGSVIAAMPIYSSTAQLYISTNGGASWTARDSSRTWSGVSMSDDGTKMVGAVHGGTVYTSTNSGATWAAQAGSGSRSWTYFASSSDGTKVVGQVYGGNMYTSTDSGVTWTARASSLNWYGIASSSDGTKLMAVAFPGQIYTSTDSGVTWTARDSSRNWQSVASDSTGTLGVAVEQSASIYVSTNSGLNWTGQSVDTMGHYRSAMSADGSVSAMTSRGSGLIYTSQDNGVTWTTHPGVNDWAGITISSDGGIIVAAGGTGIYKATCQ